MFSVSSVLSDVFLDSLFMLFCFLFPGKQVVQHAAEEEPGAGHSGAVRGGGKQ